MVDYADIQYKGLKLRTYSQVSEAPLQIPEAHSVEAKHPWPLILRLELVGLPVEPFKTLSKTA